MSGEIIGYNKLAEAGFTPNLGGVSWEETRGLPGSDRIRYDTGSGQYSFKGKPSSTGAYKSISGITPEAFKRGMSLAMFYGNEASLLATAIGGKAQGGPTAADIRGFGDYDSKAIFEMMTSPSYSPADGWAAMKDGWASDGMSGMFGALFSAEGSSLLSLSFWRGSEGARSWKLLQPKNSPISNEASIISWSGYAISTKSEHGATWEPRASWKC